MTTPRHRRLGPALIATALLTLALAGCTDDSGDAQPAPANNAANNDGGNNDTAAPMCFEGEPTTHLELLNACTDAVGIEKNPNLPLLGDDGSLPPLP